jgi:hypothetical protein
VCNAEPIAECETNREDEEEEEAPIELEYRDVAKLLLTALACLVVIVLVTFGLHMVCPLTRCVSGHGVPSLNLLPRVLVGVPPGG